MDAEEKTIAFPMRILKKLIFFFQNILKETVCEVLEYFYDGGNKNNSVHLPYSEVTREVDEIFFFCTRHGSTIYFLLSKYLNIFTWSLNGWNNVTYKKLT